MVMGGRHTAMVRSVSSANVWPPSPPAAASASRRNAPITPGTAGMVGMAGMSNSRPGGGCQPGERGGSAPGREPEDPRRWHRFGWLAKGGWQEGYRGTY